ncbi:MAG: ribonuclease Z, partial [Euryarchaeota archaeon]|nr:ribonuclease Z [Euryarchaeota archaeon]
TAGAIASPNRSLPAIALRIDDQIVLLDCGDGALHQIVKADLDFLNINNLFLSHLHADHFSGLLSLIHAMALKNREAKLEIYGPEGTKGKLDSLLELIFVGKLGFEISVLDIGVEKFKLVKDKFQVLTAFMDHGAPTLGFRIETKKSVITYSGDTQPCNGIINLAKNADILIHDSSFGDELIDKAVKTQHSTAGQAGEVAKKAGVSKLFLTHIYPEYAESDYLLLKQASEKFDGQVFVAKDLEIIVL